MKSDKKLIEEYNKSRDELNWRVTSLIKNSPRERHKSKVLILSLVILTTALILLLASIVFLSSRQPIYNIKNTYPTLIKNITQIREFKKEVHLEPDYVEECVKLREINSDVYQIKCKKNE